MHERDRRRAAPNPNRVAPRRAAEPDFTESKSYKRFVSKKTSFIIGSILLLAGLFGCVDYFGPRTISHEKILGFPGAGNVFLIRTAESYFAIDVRIRHETRNLHDAPVDVEKSLLTKTPLSFRLPQNYGEEVFYPLETRYAYIWSFVLCAVAGLVLFFYPKYDFSRIYLIVFSIIIFLATVLPPLWIQWTINSIYDVKTVAW
ncbi:MAG: hypothetical protein M3R17_02390 [Bacteroidota bacterium]|nr:hypothetical protein [Bacteroidota bacterium]